MTVPHAPDEHNPSAALPPAPGAPDDLVSTPCAPAGALAAPCQGQAQLLPVPPVPFDHALSAVLDHLMVIEDHQLAIEDHLQGIQCAFSVVKDLLEEVLP